MRRISRVDIQRLYFDENLSMQETADRLGKNITQVYKFMRRHNIPRRSSAETRNIYFRRSPPSFRKKEKLTTVDNKLHSASLMLYWAEGYKVGKWVDFTNSNPEMVKIFTKCMRNIYQIEEKRLRVQIYCYSNQNLDEITNYWSKEIKIPESQFIKPFVRHDFKIEKSDKMPYGLVHIRYYDKRLLEQIVADIGKIAMELS